MTGQNLVLIISELNDKGTDEVIFYLRAMKANFIRINFETKGDFTLNMSADKNQIEFKNKN